VCNFFSPFLTHKKKVKCTLVQALRLCTGCTAHRRSRGIALLFLDSYTRRGWGVGVTPQALFTPGKDPVPIVQEAGWAPGLVWTGAENLAATGIRSPDRPACSQLLYRLSYRVHCFNTYFIVNKIFHFFPDRPFTIKTGDLTFNLLTAKLLATSIR